MTIKTHRLGFDIGGTKCAVLLGVNTPAGISICERVAFPTAPEGGPAGVLRRLQREAEFLLVQHAVASESVAGIGISCGGPLDSRRGLVLSPPNLPGWDAVPIVRHFTDAMGLPTHLQNDANACALAEYKWGAGRGCRNMVFLTFGTGMGAGLILEGRLYPGSNDLGGEAGHLRLAEDGPVGFGKAGSFEGFCSGGGIARLAQARLKEAWAKGASSRLCAAAAGLETVTAQKVFDAAAAGDGLARGVIATCGEYLGRGLAVLVDILNPEVIVIGSIFARQEAVLRPLMQAALEREAIPLALAVCRVVPAQLGEQIGDYASLAIAEGI
ncbi:MAG: ROK family protein [Planctomycetota bacterium]